MKAIHLQRLATSSAFAAVIILGLTLGAQRGHADSDKDTIASQVIKAPVTLNFSGKDRLLVAYGSYLVNTVSDCNGCHTTSPATEYAAGGNPFFGQHPKKVNPATYLAGGQSFGSLIPGSAEIVSRNLTPNKTGRPAGGLTYDQFKQVMRTGVDLDHLHPTCAGAPTASCIPAPFDGSLLQVMPWPAFEDMTELDLRAIYEYLSAVPCIAGPPAPSVLHNDCK